MAQPRPAVHRSIFVVDIEGFGDRRRTNLDQLHARDGLYRALDLSFRQAGIRRADCHEEDRGDGVFILAPASVPKGLFVESLPHALVEAHSALLFEPVKGTAVIQAGMGDVSAILDTEATRSLLDHAQPTGLIAPVLHFIPTRFNPAAIIADYRDRLVSGSYIAIAHVAGDTGTPGLAEVVNAYQRATFPLIPRTYTEVMAMCAGLELVWPGLVSYALWRPEGPEDVSADPKINSVLYSAVGRKP